MNYRQFLLAVIAGLLVLFNFACAGKANSSADAEVVFDDGYRTTEKGEIIIDDSSFDQTSQPSAKREAREEKPVQLKDESLLTVMYDGFGNKIEMREFPRDARLLMLTVNTSTNGNQEIMVRGRNGERKTLPPDSLADILTANADEIAQTAGIFVTQREISLPPLVATQREQPKQIYQPMRSLPVPQNIEEPVKEENPPNQTEENAVEQKSEKSEEKSQSQQDSIPKDTNNH